MSKKKAKQKAANLALKRIEDEKKRLKDIEQKKIDFKAESLQKLERNSDEAEYRKIEVSEKAKQEAKQEAEISHQKFKQKEVSRALEHTKWLKGLEKEKLDYMDFVKGKNMELISKRDFEAYGIPRTAPEKMMPWNEIEFYKKGDVIAAITKDKIDHDFGFVAFKKKSDGTVEFLNNGVSLSSKHDAINELCSIIAKS